MHAGCLQAPSSYTLTADVDDLVLTGGAISGTGNVLANAITGNALANTLNGLGGDDVINGGAGRDIIDGGDGIDRLTGGEGSDQLKGDGGNDILIGDLAGYDVLATGLTLLVNGSFEQPGATFTSASWGRAMAVLPGWTRANSQSYEVMVSGYGGVSASDGNYWLDLESGGGAGARAGKTNRHARRFCVGGDPGQRLAHPPGRGRCRWHSSAPGART